MRWGARFLVAATAVALVLSGIAQAANAQVDEPQRLFDMANDARAAAGLQPLVADAELSRIAAAHAQRMRDDGTIYHNENLRSDLDGTSFRTAGENVGVGPVVERIHEGFMASDVHRHNILGSFDRLGVGTARAGDRVYVVQVFVASQEQVEPPTVVIEPAPEPAEPADEPPTIVTVAEIPAPTANVLSGGMVEPSDTIRAEDGSLVPCWFFGQLTCSH